MSPRENNRRIVQTPRPLFQVDIDEASHEVVVRADAHQGATFDGVLAKRAQPLPKARLQDGDAGHAVALHHPPGNNRDDGVDEDLDAFLQGDVGGRQPQWNTQLGGMFIFTLNFTLLHHTAANSLRHAHSNRANPSAFLSADFYTAGISNAAVAGTKRAYILVHMYEWLDFYVD